MSRRVVSGAGVGWNPFFLQTLQQTLGVPSIYQIKRRESRTKLRGLPQNEQQGVQEPVPLARESIWGLPQEALQGLVHLLDEAIGLWMVNGGKELFDCRILHSCLIKLEVNEVPLSVNISQAKICNRALTTPVTCMPRKEWRQGTE